MASLLGNVKLVRERNSQHPRPVTIFASSKVPHARIPKDSPPDSRRNQLVILRRKGLGTELFVDAHGELSCVIVDSERAWQW